MKRPKRKTYNWMIGKSEPVTIVFSNNVSKLMVKAVKKALKEYGEAYKKLAEE